MLKSADLLFFFGQNVFISYYKVSNTLYLQFLAQLAYFCKQILQNQNLTKKNLMSCLIGSRQDFTKPFGSILY